MAKRPQSSGVGENLLPLAPRSAEHGSVLVAGLVDLELSGLRLQWRNHLGGTPPAHLPRWLLLRVLAYRIQANALGGLDKETLRTLRQPKGQTVHSLDDRPFERRIPKTREGTTLMTGALLTREWNGKLERVMVLEKGFTWNGKSYGSLSRIAKAMTGTNWNGHQFFGLRTARSDPLRRGRTSQAIRRGSRSTRCRVWWGYFGQHSPSSLRHVGERPRPSQRDRCRSRQKTPW